MRLSVLVLALTAGALPVMAHGPDPVPPALDDQQLAGLLMWVPMGLVYFGTCLWLASRLVTPLDHPFRPEGLTALPGRSVTRGDDQPDLP